MSTSPSPRPADSFRRRRLLHGPHRRWWLGLLVLAVPAALFVLWLMWERSLPELASAPDFSPAQVRAGARVVAQGDCMVCHTAEGGRPFAGGRPLLTPFGTIYATNITPDRATGIGGWSREAFTRALRHGIARDGHQLYPAFPYTYYTRLPQADIDAAYAYLMTREAIRQEAPPNRLMFPLGFRPLLAFWNLLYLRPGEQVPPAGLSALEQRGFALVEGAGHCAACHSPLGPLGAIPEGRRFDGGLVDGWEAPALNRLLQARTPWTREQLVQYLGTGWASAHGAAAGPMRPVVRELATLPGADVEAIAAYLMRLQKPADAATTRTALKADMGDLSVRRGEQLFAGVCLQCHADSAPMRVVGGRPRLADSSALQAQSPHNLVQMIVQGLPWDGHVPQPYMPAYAGTLDAVQIADIAAYLRVVQAGRPAWPETEKLATQALKEARP